MQIELIVCLCKNQTRYSLTFMVHIYWESVLHVPWKGKAPMMLNPLREVVE